MPVPMPESLTGSPVACLRRHGGMTFYQMDIGYALVIRWRNSTWFILLVVGLIAAIGFLIHGLMQYGGMVPGDVLARCGVIAFMSYAVLAWYVNRTVFVVKRESFHVYRGPLPFFRRRIHTHSAPEFVNHHVHSSWNSDDEGNAMTSNLLMLRTIDGDWVKLLEIPTSSLAVRSNRMEDRTNWIEGCLNEAIKSVRGDECGSPHAGAPSSL